MRNQVVVVFFFLWKFMENKIWIEIVCECVVNSYEIKLIPSPLILIIYGIYSNENNWPHSLQNNLEPW